MKNKILTDVDCIGGKMNRVCFVQDKALLRRNPMFDLRVRSSVESRWIVHQESSLERAETGIEMIESLIDEPQTDHLDTEQLRDQRVCIELCAKTVPCPK